MATDANKRQRVREVFLELADLPETERPAALDRACGGDAALRAGVEALLHAEQAAGGFMGSPTVPAGHARGGAATFVDLKEEGPGTRIGPDKLLQSIGEGGFGSVFMAEQTAPVVRKVALKIIKLGMDTRQVVARFEQERQALAMMDHQNIARVLDAGATETGRPYFVMELVKGDPIVAYCDKNNLSIAQRLELFAQVCSAVQHAHTKGIIHRDIKPSNILVSTQDGRPHVKVIDFGIAKATASKLTEKTLFTEHRAMIGTPEYMSPEQADGSLDIDTRTDVYSLGVLLYELLTGTTPFSSSGLRTAAYDEIQRIIREVEPKKPSTRISENTEILANVAAHRHTEPKKLGLLVRGELDWIVMRAMEKDRQRRYETANGLAMDVGRYLAGEAVLAAPPSAMYRMRKFVRRNRTVVIAGSLIAVALVAGLAATAWQATIASERAVAARTAEGEAKAARDAERARADELWQVSEFQKQMLKQVDATTAGVRLTEDVNRRFAAALEKAKVPDAERDLEIDAFRAEWARVNATDAAAALIDETILKPAVKAIDEQFEDQPAVAAQLRQTLAQRYVGLGLYDAAFPLQKSALEIRRRELGGEHRETLDSVNCMGHLLMAQGRFAEAEPYFREALKKRHVLGEEHPSTITSINNMGFLLQAQGKLAEAEPYYREALEKSRRALGAEHPGTLGYVNNMGFLLEAQGRLAEAEPYYREALETRRRVLGEEHPETLTSINNMGFLLESQGKLAEAEPYYREALEKSRRVLGEEHPRTLTSINNMGSLLQSQGKLAEAESHYREALEKSRRALGAEHPDTLKSIGNMGGLLVAQGKLAEAEPYHREALEKSRRVLGAEHPGTLVCFDNLGHFLQSRGGSSEAAVVFAEGVAACRRAFTSPHAITALLLQHQADALRSLGRLDDAARGARDAVDMYRDHPGWASSEAVQALTILAAILNAQGQADEALVVQRERLALQRRRFPPGSADVSGSIAVCGLALLQRGTLDAAKEAEPLLRECLNIRLGTMPDGWHVPQSMSLLGAAILSIADLDSALTLAARSARLQEAATLLLDGYAGLRDHPAVPAPAEIGADRRREALERVVRLYEVWDRAEPGKGFDAKAAEWKARLDAAPEKKP